MDTLLSYAGIILPPIPKDMVPYSLLWLMIAILGVATFVSSMTTKTLRKREYEYQKEIKEKDRLLERDDTLIEYLESRNDKLVSVLEELDPDGDIYSPP
ncbi:hypothetical protein VP5_026 [Vibrio virus VPMCC5]|uniref:hypothetical protein n=1 Tax=Salmonella enterica TaxID=28901 RepID=UPI00288D6BF8|nr:hypothetical protein [Salmonella enterica]MDT1790506.1 hypothetical protein [Salmonella enterica subsp. enterica serovar Oslo]UIW11038.1 hypothetical protein VP5_026 [Vibrio virus VPMCC5]